MDAYLIPQFSQTLEDFRTYFVNQSHSLNREIRTSTERFTEQDKIEFDKVLREIRQFALSKLTNFINSRIEVKSKTFIELFDGYEDNTYNLSRDLETFRADIEEQARLLKVKEERGENMLDKITQKYSKTEIMKKGFQGFKQNAESNLKQKKLQAKAQLMYETKLKKISFFPWRALTYKDGYQNSVKTKNIAQIRRIHSQFGSIVTVLKEKIMQTQQLLKTKRAAKNQFAYALSKNLLKTISNLSLEVMSLNQVATGDRESQKQTEQFLHDIHAKIRNRVENITTIYSECKQVNNPEAKGDNKESQERKQVPSRILSPKTKEKRISFA